MFTSILNTYNPKDKRSFGVLRLFAEDLSESERIEFVELIFEKGSWILPTEISKTSNSDELKKISNDIFYQIFDKWTKKRIEHSSQIQIYSKDPFITIALVSDFRELLLSIRNLNFPTDLLTIFDNLFDNCHPIYFKKFIQNSISVVIEEYNETELELFFTYISKKYIEKKSINYSNFVYIYLNQLAYSYKIHDLSSEFLIHLDQLSDFLSNSDKKKDYYLLISTLLIDLIKNKKLDLSNLKYNSKISEGLENLEKGNHNDLDFYKFLKQFNYPFSTLDSNLEIDVILKKLNEVVQICKKSDDQHKKDTLNHYIRSSDKHFEFFLFFLEHCSEIDSEKYFINFINIIDELRKSFSQLLWFDEFLNFKSIKGEIITKIINGHEVKVDETFFNNIVIEKKLQSELSNDFIEHHGYGFLKQANLKAYVQKENINLFFISNINYSIFNKGKVISLVVYNEDVEKIISKFEIKALFSSVELFLIETAHKYLNLESPFSKKTNMLKQLVSPDFIYDFTLSFSIESFWNILKVIRPRSYESIYINHQNNEESFKKIVNIYENDQTVEGLIHTRKNGGMSVDIFGFEAFLPGSQIDIKLIEDYDSYLNKTIDFKILKINYDTKNIVVSHKILIEKQNDYKKHEFLSKLEKGQVLDGTIKNITSYGAFVDLDCVDGLIHIKDLTWSRINHPKEILELGQQLKVLVLDFDYEKTKIELGIKQLDFNFIKTFKELKNGDKVKGIVTSILPYGLLVKVNNINEALIHVSELRWSRIPEDIKSINYIKKLYSLGDTVEAKIIDINSDEYKISMSIKQLYDNPWSQMIVGQKLKGKVSGFTDSGVIIDLTNFTSGFINISELSYLRVPKNLLNNREYIRKNIPFSNDLEVLIISIDKANETLSLSLKQLKPNPWHSLITNIKKSDILKGRVKNITELGAFIKLENGLEGLIYISNLHNFSTIENKREKYLSLKKLLTIGKIVDVEVLNVNYSKCRISLGLKNFKKK